MSFVVFVPLCHCSASLCVCYRPFCLLSNLRNLLTCLLVLESTLIYTYYGMIGCMTCVSLTTCLNVLLGLIGVCLLWYLFWFKTVIGMRSSLTIVCTNSVFPFCSVFSCPGANWVFFLLCLFLAFL